MLVPLLGDAVVVALMKRNSSNTQAVHTAAATTKKELNQVVVFVYVYGSFMYSISKLNSISHLPSHPRALPLPPEPLSQHRQTLVDDRMLREAG